ncbi:MAG TPA: hypothetical protein VJ732_10855, partial [Bryobacteraceae bacterium]|nr:hypothetical protein [Bryobacteraceae bacterium]
MDHGIRIADQALNGVAVFELAANPLDRDSLEVCQPRWRAHERAYPQPFFYESLSYRAADETGRPRQGDDAAHGFGFCTRASVEAFR